MASQTSIAAAFYSKFKLRYPCNRSMHKNRQSLFLKRRIQVLEWGAVDFYGSSGCGDIASSSWRVMQRFKGLKSQSPNHLANHYQNLRFYTDDLLVEGLPLLYKICDFSHCDPGGHYCYYNSLVSLLFFIVFWPPGVQSPPRRGSKRFGLPLGDNFFCQG